jgi:hypothetical protein
VLRVLLSLFSDPHYSVVSCSHVYLSPYINPDKNAFFKLVYIYKSNVATLRVPKVQVTLLSPSAGS